MKTLRLSEGGWVLVLAAAVIASLLIWALAPAVLRLVDRPPGDGRTIESYGFKTDNPRLPDSAPIQIALQHRDMVPVLEAPPTIIDATEASREVPRKGPFLTSGDLVIGVEHEGLARAWPLLLLNVHEVMHDDFAGGVVVSWHWPSGATAVYERTIDGTPQTFGVSGLAAGGGQLLYVRNAEGAAGGEGLVSQFTGQSVTGPDLSLKPVPYSLTTWGQWRQAHPETSVVGPDQAMLKRYKKGKPDTWFNSSRLLFDLPVPEGGPSPKSPAVVLEAPGETRTITVDDFPADGALTVDVGGHQVVLNHPEASHHIEVDAPDEVVVRRGIWQLVHSLGY